LLDNEIISLLKASNIKFPFQLTLNRKIKLKDNPNLSWHWIVHKKISSQVSAGVGSVVPH